MNRLKRYLPLSAMKLTYDSLILSHLQFRITNWGFEWDRISKLQKRALRFMINSRYNAHAEPLFKQLNLLKVKDIFEIQSLKCWYKYVNNKLPNYFRNMFTYNHELHEIETRNHNRLHLCPTCLSGARNVFVLGHHIPELLKKSPPPPHPPPTPPHPTPTPPLPPPPTPTPTHTYTHIFGRHTTYQMLLDWLI